MYVRNKQTHISSHAFLSSISQWKDRLYLSK